MCEITLNPEKNGIEVRFEGKPAREILDKLKANGFRWSNRQKMWYAKHTDERLTLVNSFSNSKTKTEKESTADVYDLWELTRIESIGEHDEEMLSTKEIAAIIRKHFRKRFPMFKFSVTSDYDSISVHLMESPYEKNSEEVDAVLEYAGEYVESYKQVCRWGSFYGGRRYPSVSYNCVFRDMTVSELNIRERFAESKAVWEEKEAERRMAEFRLAEEQRERDRIEYEKAEAERNRCHKIIEDSVIVNNVDYFVLGLIDPGFRKEDWLSEYKREEYKEYQSETKAKCSKEVHFTQDVYEMFVKQLMDDYSFIEHTGGSQTEDYRVNSSEDYDNMTESERKTVEWYSCNCVAVYCENELMFVIDAQGFSYARYVFLVSDNTEITKDYVPSTGISKEDFESRRNRAAIIEDVSTELITENGWENTWNTDNQLEYIDAMKEWVYKNKFKLTKNIVQQISIDSLKNMMYRVLTKIDSLWEQFKVANLQDGQQVTIIHISDFGGLSCAKVTTRGVEYSSYAQHEEAIRFICKPIHKRSDYYQWFYRDVLIVDGWVDIPENVLFDITETDTYITKKSKFLSCDSGQYDAVSEYLKSQGITPLINTYNPEYRK